ncbi:MAG: MBL fold metallo-hydrolase [Pseudomonadales bacterium]|nr:MBL fold metallo-hydrolase [Pseudomonadales bacterium]MCP5185882.1 MBL fold metallo-hydrolase [Pseudomonadales bacterium]
MSLTFFGAAREVTGSCHVLEVGDYRVLLDCGLVQGDDRQEARNYEPFPFEAHGVDAVVLSHAHIDHSGRLPLLERRGFRGRIHAQQASAALASILLRDAANIAASRARHAIADGETGDMAHPLFDTRDVERTLRRFVTHHYAHWFEVVPGLRARFLDAGHILGSSVVELAVEVAGGTRRIVFSGDLGQYDSPILRDPESPECADLVLMESTYGDRRHKSRERSIRELGELILDTDPAESHIVVPAFAVGRSQELLYQLGRHAEAWGLDRWHIFLDSPLAIEASDIYWDHHHLFDDEAYALRREFDHMPALRNLHFTRTAAESRVINRMKGGGIIIAGSGTCGGGRILHHLRHVLDGPQHHVLFTGYQPRGSLGRAIIDGARRVRIHGQSIEVRAQLHTIGGLSAHGDYEDLIRWYRAIPGKPPVCLVHGDLDAMQALQFRLTREVGASATIPEPGESVSL